MPEWIQPLLGQGGALIILAIVSRGGFKFFTTMIAKQDVKYDRQAQRFDELHTSTLEHIHEQTEALRRLHESIEGKKWKVC